MQRVWCILSRVSNFCRRCASFMYHGICILWLRFRVEGERWEDRDGWKIWVEVINHEVVSIPLSNVMIMSSSSSDLTNIKQTTRTYLLLCISMLM